MGAPGWRNGADLPAVGDPGDVLTVVDGAWAPAAPDAPVVPVTSVAGETGDISAADLRAALGTPLGGTLGSQPGVNDDNTAGYEVGSFIVAADGTPWACTDASTGAAVWRSLLTVAMRLSLVHTADGPVLQPQYSPSAALGTWTNTGSPIAATSTSGTWDADGAHLPSGTAQASPSALGVYATWDMADLAAVWDMSSGVWSVGWVIPGSPSVTNAGYGVGVSDGAAGAAAGHFVGVVAKAANFGCFTSGTDSAWSVTTNTLLVTTEGRTRFGDAGLAGGVGCLVLSAGNADSKTISDSDGGRADTLTIFAVRQLGTASDDVIDLPTYIYASRVG